MLELENLGEDKIKYNDSRKESLINKFSTEPREHRNQDEIKVYGAFINKQFPQKIGNLKCLFGGKFLIGNNRKSQ